MRGLGHPRAGEGTTARWLLGGGGGGRFRTRCPGLAHPFLLVPVPRSRREAVGSGAARAGGGSRVPGPRGALRARRAAAAHGVQRGADQHPGELLPAAAVPGRRRAPAAGGQDAPLRGAGERGALAAAQFRITRQTKTSLGGVVTSSFLLPPYPSLRSRPGFRTAG